MRRVLSFSFVVSTQSNLRDLVTLVVKFLTSDIRCNRSLKQSDVTGAGLAILAINLEACRLDFRCDFRNLYFRQIDSWSESFSRPELHDHLVWVGDFEFVAAMSDSTFSSSRIGFRNQPRRDDCGEPQSHPLTLNTILYPDVPSM